MDQYGAFWIKSNFDCDMSPLGENVADLLGVLVGGIYHLDGGALSRVDWGNDHHVEFIWGWHSLATFDSNELTRLVFLCHDRLLRVQIDAASPNHLRLIFHQRRNRDGKLFERHPTIEDALRRYRQFHPLKIEPVEEKDMETLCEWCNENTGVTNSQYWKEEGESEGHWVCLQCEETDLAEEHEAEMRELSAAYRRRPETSDLYQYPVFDGDDVALCPRCRDVDIFPGARVCGSCLSEINADDFS